MQDLWIIFWPSKILEIFRPLKIPSKNFPPLEKMTDPLWNVFWRSFVTSGDTNCDNVWCNYFISCRLKIKAWHTKLNWFKLLTWGVNYSKKRNVYEKFRFCIDFPILYRFFNFQFLYFLIFSKSFRFFTDFSFFSVFRQLYEKFRLIYPSDGSIKIYQGRMSWIVYGIREIWGFAIQINFMSLHQELLETLIMSVNLDLFYKLFFIRTIF